MLDAPSRTPSGSARRSTTEILRGSSRSSGEEAAIIITAEAVAGAMLACTFFAFRKNY
ncbi:MAG: hypothetical protein IKN41_02035 [Candidatus Methanomethylophilaceae archaeon]|nr:hypothetical protein [Candidatus Methanomethylophilaceae archaeon]